MLIEDTRTYPDWVAQWQRSYIGTPIIIDDEVIGFLNLDSTRSRQFQPDTRRTLQAFADR